MECAEDLEIFFRLFVKFLAKLGHMEQEWGEEVLEDAKHFFDATVDEDSANQCLKDVTHDLARLKQLNITIVHLEVLLEGVEDVAVQIVLLVEQLLLLFLLPVRHRRGLRGVSLTAS